jgi:hypothetical protein
MTIIYISPNFYAAKVRIWANLAVNKYVSQNKDPYMFLATY